MGRTRKILAVIKINPGIHERTTARNDNIAVGLPNGFMIQNTYDPVLVR